MNERREHPYIDAFEVLDPGDDPAAAIGMLASRQVHFIDGADIIQLATFQNMAHVDIHTANTARTAVARFRRGSHELADNVKVNKALRMAVDSATILGLAYRLGVPRNTSNFSNPTFDALLSKAEGILDVEARREVMVEIQTLMQEEGPIVQPLWQAVYTPADKAVVGLETHPTGYCVWENYGLTA